jgi:hypothetical protein
MVVPTRTPARLPLPLCGSFILTLFIMVLTIPRKFHLLAAVTKYCSHSGSTQEVSSTTSCIVMCSAALPINPRLPDSQCLAPGRRAWKLEPPPVLAALLVGGDVQQF